MKKHSSSILRIAWFCCSLVIAASLTRADVATSYTLNLNPGTSAGNPVTNIMIFEANADGSQLLIDYGGSASGYTISGQGLSTLTHMSAFTPAFSLLVGITQQIDKLSLVFFTNNAFATQAAGTNFNPNFYSITHNALIDHIKAAESGSASDLAWFRDSFWPLDGTRTAFATGGPHSAIEFTVGQIISPVPEQSGTLLLLGASSAVLLFTGRRWRTTRGAA